MCGTPNSSAEPRIRYVNFVAAGWFVTASNSNDNISSIARTKKSTLLFKFNLYGLRTA